MGCLHQALIVFLILWTVFITAVATFLNGIFGSGWYVPPWLAQKLVACHGHAGAKIAQWLDLPLPRLPLTREKAIQFLLVHDAAYWRRSTTHPGWILHREMPAMLRLMDQVAHSGTVADVFQGIVRHTQTAEETLVAVKVFVVNPSQVNDWLRAAALVTACVPGGKMLRMRLQALQNNWLQQLSATTEAVHVERFHQRYRFHPKIKIPAVIVSSQQVLVMEWLEREHKAVINVDALCGFVCSSILVEGEFHMDLQRHNLLPLAHGCLGIVDFGLVGRLEPSMRHELMKMLCICFQDRDWRSAAAVLLRDILRVPLQPQLLQEVALLLEEYLEKCEKNGIQSMKKLSDLLRRWQDHLPESLAQLEMSLLTMEQTLKPFCGDRTSPPQMVRDFLRRQGILRVQG